MLPQLLLTHNSAVAIITNFMMLTNAEHDDAWNVIFQESQDYFFLYIHFISAGRPKKLA